MYYGHRLQAKRQKNSRRPKGRKTAGGQKALQRGFLLLPFFCSMFPGMYSTRPGLFETRFLRSGPDFLARPGFLQNPARPGPVQNNTRPGFKTKPGPARPGPVLEILENHSFPSCVCCPAGGLDFGKSRFLYGFNLLHVAKLPHLLGFESREYASRLH